MLTLLPLGLPHPPFWLILVPPLDSLQVSFRNGLYVNNSSVWFDPCEQTDMTENITFPQLRWQAVTTENLVSVIVSVVRECEIDIAYRPIV